jgi:hypothetical protein
MSAELLSSQGYLAVPALLPDRACDHLTAAIEQALPTSAGTRCLLSLDWCQDLALRLREHPGLAGLLPAGHVAVQCSYFAKSLSRNWLVPIHQDLSIPVAARVDDGDLRLRGWSEKEGQLFVQAPVDLLERLLAVRVHLDPCGPDDGPLLVIPGTHRQGLIAPEAAVAARREQTPTPCVLARGDVLLMRPLLLHASSKAGAASACRRRVLHFLFGPRDLPGGLRWRHEV